MALLMATNNAHKGAAINKLVPLMVKIISSAKPPISPIKLSIQPSLKVKSMTVDHH